MTIDPQSPDLALGVIGTGTMGRGIAQIAAAGGVSVRLYDTRDGAAEEASAFVARMLRRAAEKGGMTEGAAESAIARLDIVDGLDAMAGAGVVVEAIVEELEAKGDLGAVELRRLVELKVQLDNAERRWRSIPYIDPLDIRYNRFEQHPEPKTNAVMFCLMDVSGSMGPREKDLAKRFFILLHLFLTRRYERIDTVFIRHTHKAQEVDEETFFYSRETGGTVVSTALIEMQKILSARYPVQDWNIYAAQASDGDNFEDDTGQCLDLLSQQLLPLCQYFAYVEILDERELQLFQNSNGGKTLWRGYRKLGEEWPNFAQKRISTPGDIYPVFRELFGKQTEAA